MTNSRIWIEAVLYGSGAGRRFTQDSPVLPDVWVRYLDQPNRALDLLIEPWLETQPSRIAEALLRRLKNESQGFDPDVKLPDEDLRRRWTSMRLKIRTVRKEPGQPITGPWWCRS